MPSRAAGSRVLALLTLVSLLLLTACLPVARPVLKLGLVAPFEGRYRDVGYEVIYAVRLAVREANARGGVAGHTVELVALDDGGDPALAVEQAQKLAADPQLMAVLGHWLDETTTAAAPDYAEAGLPFLATAAAPLPASTFRLWPDTASLAAALPPGSVPCVDNCGWIEGAAWLQSLANEDLNTAPTGSPLWGFPQMATLAGPALQGVLVPLPAPLPAHSADPAFAERYRSISNGVEPRAYAVLAYDAANVLFEALEASDSLTREGVAAALRGQTTSGVSGEVGFGAAGVWVGGVWVYRWQEGVLRRQP